jgi:predicted nuclease of restriction endonuclease-like (RecB) superfamily
MNTPARDFEGLVGVIAELHRRLQHQATRAINTSLTLRNWLMGAHIHEFELRGQDRAEYGERLLPLLSERLRASGIPRVDERELRRYRLFYLAYPQIREALPPEFQGVLPAMAEGQEIREALPPESRLSGAEILRSLSFTHIVELMALDDPIQRRFYELEAIRGQWSTRELKRQIASLAFERTGLSTDRARLLEQIRQAAEADNPALVIRDPYVFEFLGIRPPEVMGESRLEDALLDRVQQFLLELGRGFCFEARQKRIRIGDEFYFVDLVFYHRLLKCHVLVELKVDEFRHEYLGQLNTYVNWFRKHEMAEGDNPPVGLLLCTRKNHALMEYALAGMDNRLFVSRYQLELPRREEIVELLEQEMRELGAGETED